MNSIYPNRPDIIILDLTEGRDAFGATAKDMTEYQFEMNEVVDGVLAHINFDQTAEAGLETLANSIIQQFTEENNPNEGFILATATVNFGKCLVKQLRELKAYDHEGMFPYHLGGWLNPDTPVLELDPGKK